MEQRGIIGWLYNLADFIMRLAYVNLLWILFTLMGVVVLGGFPSTVALYTVTRKWVLKKTDISVWKTFWGTFKREFGKANLVGYLFLIIGTILFADLKFFQSHHGSGFLLIYYVFLMLFIFYSIMGMFLFPVYVHFELKTLHYLKQTFFFILSRPIEALLAAAGCFAVYLLMIKSPGLILFFSMSLTAYILTWLAQRGFSKIGRLLEEREENREK